MALAFCQALPHLGAGLGQGHLRLLNAVRCDTGDSHRLGQGVPCQGHTLAASGGTIITIWMLIELPLPRVSLLRSVALADGGADVQPQPCRTQALEAGT